MEQHICDFLYLLNDTRQDLALVEANDIQVEDSRAAQTIPFCPMAAAPVSAAQAVGEYLQSPDDLVKISAYRKKLEKEKASIDAKLKSGVKEQLHSTRDGLRKLLSTRDNVQAIKDELNTMEVQCMDPQNSVSTFDQISRVWGVFDLPFFVFNVN